MEGAVPEPVWTFTDADSYLVVKKAVRTYAYETLNAPGVRYFKLIEQYKNKVHFWVLNGGGDLPADYQYVLSVDGPADQICVKCADFMHNVVLDGLVLRKNATMCFCAPKLELRNCTWATPEASLAVRSCNCKLKLTNPTGTPMIEITSDCCRRVKEPKGLGKELAGALLMAKLLYMV